MPYSSLGVSMKRRARGSNPGKSERKPVLSKPTSRRRKPDAIAELRERIDSHIPSRADAALIDGDAIALSVFAP